MRRKLLLGVIACAFIVDPGILAYGATDGNGATPSESQYRLSYDQMTFKPASVIQQEQREFANPPPPEPEFNWQFAPVNLMSYGQ